MISESYIKKKNLWPNLHFYVKINFIKIFFLISFKGKIRKLHLHNIRKSLYQLTRNTVLTKKDNLLICTIIKNAYCVIAQNSNHV